MKTRQVGVVLAVVFIGCGLLLPAAGWAQARPPVRLAYLQLGWAATEIIHQADLLGKRGWEVTYTPLAGSPGGLVNAYAAGQVDAIDMSFAIAARMFEQGIPLRFTGVATSLLGAVVVAKEADIPSVEALRGHKVAAIIGSSTYADMRFLLKRAYGLDVEKDAQVVAASSPPELANLLERGAVAAIIGWQPITDKLVMSGRHRYLVKQIELWRKATGRQDFPVHVGYLVHPAFLEKHPRFAQDLNAAQQEAVDIWYHNPPLAIRYVAAVTKLPPELVAFAHRQTVKMMAGLSEAHLETLTLQLRLLKEAGYLQAAIWDDPARLLREFFWVP